MRMQTSLALLARLNGSCLINHTLIWGPLQPPTCRKESVAFTSKMPLCSLATAQYRQCPHLCPSAVAPTARSTWGSPSPRAGRAGKAFSHHHARSYAAAALPDVSSAPSLHSHRCHELVALRGQACALSCRLIVVITALQPLSDDSEEEEPAPRPGMAPLPDRIGFVGAGQVQLIAC